jgi:hypothetical protein
MYSTRLEQSLSGAMKTRVKVPVEKKTPSYNVTYPYIDIIKIVEIAEKLFSIGKFTTAVVSLDVQ